MAAAGSVTRSGGLQAAPGAAPGQFTLSGEVGFASARQLLKAGEAAFVGQRKASVDLSGVTATDSAGLALLLCWLADARADGRELTFERLPAQLVAIAKISEVEALLGADPP